MNAPDIEPDMQRHIQARLDDVERSKGVRILFATESGSRAWGFPSPDSDWDVRFVYAHPTPWYLSLRERRDVIEAPLDARDVDLAGWDVRKALRLLLKSNAALYEWCCSPIVYRCDGRARQDIKTLFERVAGPQALAYHYRETARTTWQRMLEGRDEVRLKRYFYVLRPLLALDWVTATGKPPPMQVQELLAAHPLPQPAAAAFDALLHAKRAAPETGMAPRVPALDDWIVPRLRAEPHVAGVAAAGHLDEAAREHADRVFRQLIGA